MGNCCSSTATVPSSSSPPSPPTRSRPEAEDALAPSSQPRSRTTSVPKPMPHGGVSSQDLNRRRRAKSAPQPPQSKSSVPQNVITRPQPVAAPSRNRFDCRTSGLEQPNVGASAPTVSYPIRNSPPSTPRTVKQRKKLQVSRGKTIRASIQAGRNGYWHNFWSRLDFADKPLKNCVDIIHTGIVKRWNPDDTNSYLSSDQFKISMSHVVKDLAVPARGASRPNWIISGDKIADWVYDAYRGSQEIVRCLMGYIVDLHVILDEITKTAICNATENDALDVMNEHVRSGRRDSIHRDIRNFVTETYPTRFSNTEKDLVLEKIIDLIRQYCDLPLYMTEVGKEQATRRRGQGN